MYIVLCSSPGAVYIVVIKRKLHYTLVPAMSTVWIIHMDAMRGRMKIVLLQKTLILVVNLRNRRFLKVLTNKTPHYTCRIDFND